jgi:uncharacterized protein YdhG (YjbR/CyaY superfamily)
MATAAKSKKAEGFTAEERAAMRARARELKGKQDGEAAIREAIAEMPDADRLLARRIHEIVTEAAPELMPKTWYGMPAYADKNGKVVCYFKCAAKFKTRYAQFGFEDAASLDDGPMWPTVFALVQLGDSEARQIAGLVRRAAPAGAHS